MMVEYWLCRRQSNIGFFNDDLNLLELLTRVNYLISGGRGSSGAGVMWGRGSGLSFCIILFLLVAKDIYDEIRTGFEIGY